MSDRSVPTTATLIQGGAVAVLAFIVLFLLGAVPGMPSPPSAELSAHRTETQLQLSNLLTTLRAICYRLPDSPRAPRCE